MKFEVEVDAVETASIQYTALVDATSAEEAIKYVKQAIDEDGTAFMQYEAIQTRVVDTVSIDSEPETVDYEEGGSTDWICREYKENKAKTIVFIENGTVLYVFQTQFIVGEYEADVAVIYLTGEEDETEADLRLAENDESLSLTYSRDDQ